MESVEQTALDTPALAVARRRMVAEQLAKRGITDGRVLDAMRTVPRHFFVAERLRDQAYEDHPLAIGYGQTISQPYMVARTLESCQIRSADRVLEVGAGSGYQTAVIAALSAEVCGAEIIAELAQEARLRITRLGLENATIEHRDGSLGWPERAPFDVIIVAAAAPCIPDPLKQQLAVGGRLVVPVGERMMQLLHTVTRTASDEWTTRSDTPCRFVDLRGVLGWQA